MTHTPMHPVTVYLPLGCWLAALLADVAGYLGGYAAAGPAAFGLLVLGTGGAALATVTGTRDVAVFVWRRRVAAADGCQAALAWHVFGMVAALVLFGVSAWLRWRYGIERVPAPPPVVATAGAGLLAAVAGAQFGMRLVYEYGVGVATAPRPDAPS